MNDIDFEAAVQRFHSMIAEACTGVPLDENCLKCWLRLYCFSAPRTLSRDMIHDVVKTLLGDAKTAPDKTEG